MMVLKVCLRQNQVSLDSGEKLRRSILKLSKNTEDPVSISTILSLLNRVFCSDSSQSRIMEQAEHSNMLHARVAIGTPRARSADGWENKKDESWGQGSPLS